MKSLSDNDIIDSVLKGNTEDFSLLIDRYKDKAFSLLKRMLRNELDAEELLMDSFMKAYSNLEGFRGDAQFSTWFYRIVYNNALSFLGIKKHKIEQEMSSVEDHFDLSQDDNKIYVESENASDYIMKMIDKLPIRQSLALILFYIDGLSVKEIAEVTDLSMVNVKVMLHRGRNSLKELILKHNLSGEIL